MLLCADRRPVQAYMTLVQTYLSSDDKQLILTLAEHRSILLTRK